MFEQPSSLDHHRVHADDVDKVKGLPAACVALCSSHRTLWLIGACAAPLAVGFEQMREAFDVA